MIGIIGFGHIARAMASGLVKSGMDKDEIIVSAKSEATRDLARKTYGFKAYPSNKDLVQDSDLLVLAVRPQDYSPILEEVREDLKGKILVSLMAGVDLKTLQEALPGVKLARFMPSIAMEVNSSLSALTLGEEIDPNQGQRLGDLFSRLGDLVVTDEAGLDKVSVLSGSGLGYVFELIDNFAKAAGALGMENREACEKMALQVFKGAVQLAEVKDCPAGDLADSVATEGGTTIEGIQVMRDQEIEKILASALQASYKKLKNI